MARLYDVGLLSSGAFITTNTMVVRSPYHSDVAYASRGSNNYLPEPVISVSGEASLDNLPFLENADVKLYCCAVPSGQPGPVNPTGLFDHFTGTEVGNTFVKENNFHSIITTVQNDLGVPTGSAGFVSGNAYYDVYGCHFVTLYNSLGVPSKYYHGNMFTIPDVLTQSPYVRLSTDVPDLVVSVSSVGESVNDNPLQIFTFNFTEGAVNAVPPLLDNPNDFGGGYPFPASSGYMRISCSGVENRLWYKPVYSAATLPSTTISYGYVEPSGTSLSFRVPKFQDADNSDNNDTGQYQSYIFKFEHINSAGVVSPAVGVGYDQLSLKKLHESAVASSDNIRIPDPELWNGPTPVVVKDKTNRHRLSLGIQDVDLQSVKYKKSGSYVSKLYASEEPIYAVSIDSTEQIPLLGSLQPWDFIKYYIQFGSAKSDEWSRISTKSRTTEIDGDQKPVPNLVILDTHMLDSEKDSLTNSNNILFMEQQKPVYNFRIKIEIDTSSSSSAGAWSPSVYDYKVRVLNRSILTSSNVERYLFT